MKNKPLDSPPHEALDDGHPRSAGPVVSRRTFLAGAASLAGVTATTVMMPGLSRSGNCSSGQSHGSTRRLASSIRRTLSV
jgi:hypothetical protein